MTACQISHEGYIPLTLAKKALLNASCDLLDAKRNPQRVPGGFSPCL